MNENQKTLATYSFPKAEGIVVCGDIHGDFKEMVYKCCVQYGMTDTLIIVAGECGFGFEREGYYENLYMHCRERLSKANNWLVFVRGNHDNPAYFDGKQVNYQRWKAVPDYTVLTAGGHTILCVGGATSVDRTYRMNDKRFLMRPKEALAPNVYWFREQPVYDETLLEAISAEHTIDTVISHTAPSFCEVKSHNGLTDWTIRDEDLLDDVKRERKTMNSIHSFLREHQHPLRWWYYGHFHQSWHSEIDGVQYNMLDCMELRELRTKE